MPSSSRRESGTPLRLRVADQCSGLGGLSEAFVRAGDHVLRVDNNRRFAQVPGTVVRSVLDDDYPAWFAEQGPFDIVLQGTPCEGFSVAGIPHHWTGGVPDAVARLGLRIVRRCIETSRQNGRAWLAENPRGMLRKVLGRPRETVFYCAYGARWMKPTDFWGNYPGSFARPCVPHEAAPRGSKLGVQGVIDPAKRAEVPLALSEAIRESILRTSALQELPA